MYVKIIISIACLVAITSCDCKRQQLAIRSNINEAESTISALRVELDKTRDAHQELAIELQSVTASNQEYADAYGRFAENSRQSLGELEKINVEGEGTITEILAIIGVIRAINDEIVRAIQEFSEIERANRSGQQENNKGVGEQN